MPNFFSFETPQENEKKDETAVDGSSKKKADSDSEDDEQDDAQLKEKGISNKKKKVRFSAFFVHISCYF